MDTEIAATHDFELGLVLAVKVSQVPAIKSFLKSHLAVLLHVAGPTYGERVASLLHKPDRLLAKNRATHLLPTLCSRWLCVCGSNAKRVGFDRMSRLTLGSNAMSNHVYKLLELTGSSSVSIEDAVSTAIAKAHKTVRNIQWFTITETRGHVVDGKVAHWQVSLKIGFTLE
jgi:flavin-binding protein dodecin